MWKHIIDKNRKSTILIADNLINILYKHSHLRLKGSTYSFSKSKPIVCILKIKVQQGTAFSAVLFKNDVTGLPTSFFYRGKLSTLFCCRGRIEKKDLCSWLLQNNLLGVEMLFEIQKPRLFYFKQHFSTSEVILQQTW